MTNWIENKGDKPIGVVDIKLNCDEPGAPGIDMIRHNQDPNSWDWQRCIGGIEITHYRISKPYG